MNNLNYHNPVMLAEVLKNLAPKDGEIYLDCTFGAGGYSSAILQAANCKVYAIDRDELAQKFAANLSEKFAKNFTFCAGSFSQCEEILLQNGVSQIDGMVLDIGVSSMQLDDKERGFSFDSQSRLDMRMNQSQEISAFEVVNNFSENELARIIKDFGEEPKAKQIAKKIISSRAVKPINSCFELAEIVRFFYRGYFRNDPATKTFQAIRIFVNQELEELKLALNAAKKILRKNGRLVVVSFHSLEDSIVKNFLKKEAGLDRSFSRYQPNFEQEEISKNFHIISKSAISPSAEEIASNVRSRSAKMRVAIKI